MYQGYQSVFLSNASSFPLSKHLHTLLGMILVSRFHTINEDKASLKLSIKFLLDRSFKYYAYFLLNVSFSESGSKLRYQGYKWSA